MRNEDIEILDDFSDNSQNMNQNNQIINPSTIQPPQYNNPMPNYNSPMPNYNPSMPNQQPSYNPPFEPQQNYNETPQDFNQNASVNEFEQMMVESNEPEPTEEPAPLTPNNQFDYANDYANYQNNNDFNNLDYVNDSNNDLVQSNDDDLTITAVYPNGFVVPDQDEQVVENRVVKPKKSNGDLVLIIIVAVLAITLVVMLVIFYI